MRAPSVAYACAVGIASGVALASPAYAETLTLVDALNRAAAGNPLQAAAAARIEAARGGLDQAARRPNPFLSLNGENLAATQSSWSQLQTTVAYNQLWERGGKRDARMSVAGAEVDAARLRERITVLDFYHAVETVWIEAVAAEAEVGIASERVAVAERLRQETNRRVSAARDPAFAGARVGAFATQAQIARDQAVANAHIARATLASYWRGAADFELDPRALEIESDMTVRPDRPLNLALLDAQRQLADARARLETSRAVQDPTVQVGLRHFANNGELAVVAGVSVPLGFHDKNQGNIARARAESRAAEQDQAAAQMAWEREFLQLRARLDAYATESRRLSAETIPAADKALRLARDTFDRGALSYLDVTETERALTDAQARRIEVQKLYHLDMARLHRLLGSHLSDNPTKEVR